MNRKSFADQIASVLSTTPHFESDEEENLDGTKALLDSEFVDDVNEDETGKSFIRKQNIELLADTDVRYAGKKRSRKDLISDEDSSGNTSPINLQFNDEDESCDAEEEDEENVDEDSSNSDGSYLSDSENTTNFQTFNDNTSIQVKKGSCVKNQLVIWENLLEMRIQVQKCLVAANKMPQSENFKQLKTESEFGNAVQTATKSVSALLEKFLTLQNLLWKQYPEMKKSLSKQSEKNDDEEIPSDTEDEEMNEDVEDEEITPKKKLKVSDFGNELTEKHNTYKNYRNSVIQKWHDKTRIASLKNNNNVHSIINHIEHTLSDKTKLIKRTQLKRNDYKIIGEDEKEVTLEEFKEEYNTEIFDDSDFYHQLLRELIEVKSADLTDPVQLGKQWIQLQNLRSKMKRKIDTKATKGRRIRYAVHTKLVNFMAPIYNNLWTEDAKNELFGSLFGKNQISVSSK